MRPHELIRELVARQGGANAVAKKMGVPSFQGTLHRFCNNQIGTPSRSTAERIAKYFKLPIEAIYDSSMATKLARELFNEQPQAQGLEGGAGIDDEISAADIEDSGFAPPPHIVEEGGPGLIEYLKYLNDLYPGGLTEEETEEEAHAWNEFAAQRIARRLLKHKFRAPGTASDERVRNAFGSPPAHAPRKPNPPKR